MATKRILFLVGDYVEDYEVMVPFQTLAAVGYDVQAVCPARSRATTSPRPSTTSRAHRRTARSAGTTSASRPISPRRPPRNTMRWSSRADGPPSTCGWIRQVIALVRDFAAQDKPIASICHGPQVLAAAGLLKDKHVSAYPACRPDVEGAGARYAEIPIAGAVTDGKLVTAPAWPAHPAWMAQFLKVLGADIRL